MKTRHQILLLVATMLAIALPSLHAQLVADGATNTLNNVTNTFTGDMTVGTNSSFTLLILSDNALLTNSANGVIGRTATAKSNEVQLLSPTARWQMGNNLYVGSNGAFNRMVVSNGAFLNNNSGFLGNGASSSNNFALITGSGSLWTNRSDLRVGFFGRDNQMIVSNGARVVSFGGELGSQPGSSNNLVVVTGSGSVWTNVLGGWVSVGGGERGNRLVIEAGGLVDGDNGVVGTGAFGGDSEAVVTGASSRWSSRTDLVVGLNPSNNRLVVSNGAVVVAGNNGRLGAVTGSTGNVVVVTGAGSLWSNQFNLYLGEAGPGNRMEVNGGGMVVSSNTYVGYGSANNLGLVTGSGSLWSNRYNVVVGTFGSSNRLVISNGAQLVSNREGVLGSASSSVNNSALVTGPGSLWHLNRSGSSLPGLIAGDLGGGNTIVVSNGATMLVRRFLVIGRTSSAASNSVTLTDIGTKLTVFDTGQLIVGEHSANNRLVVKDGAELQTDSAYLGGGSSASNNLTLLTGAGTTWNNRGLLRFFSHRDDHLVISNGATVHTSSFEIAEHNCDAVVAGLATLLRVTNDLKVGSAGIFGAYTNRLFIVDGAIVTSSNCGVGIAADDAGNALWITGNGSVLSNAFMLRVNDSSEYINQLVVSNGATVYTGDTTVGVLSGAREGAVIITGAGSFLTNRSLFVVGENGYSQRLAVTNATATSGNGFIVGAQSTSTNNRVIVNNSILRATNASGTGMLDVRRGTSLFNGGLIDVDRLLLTNTLSRFEFNGGTLITRGAAISNNSSFVIGESGGVPAVWDVRAGAEDHILAAHLYVGLNNSSFNQLFVTNGALFTNLFSFNVGSGSSNTAIISGPGSRCGIAGGISVGGAHFNRLVVSNGASLFSRGDSYIGGLFSGTNNQIVVTGPGSVWNQFGPVEFSSRGNQLLVTEGGLLVCSNAYEGFFGTGSNLMLVAGPGSVLNCIQTLGVGSNGRGNQLHITNGALVTVGNNLLVGSSSSNNLVLVDNGILRVTNLTATGLLEVRRGSNVFNAGLIEADILLRTNVQGFFDFNGGTLAVKNSNFQNGQVFRVGNGVTPATVVLAGGGSGYHEFAPPASLSISTNGTLTGNGSIAGGLTVQAGGLLSPGHSIGTISVSSIVSPSLQGTVLMEISKNGSVLTNDALSVTVAGPLNYGGALVVTNLGPGALAAGDRFQLFSASAYAGAFAPITLPPLAPLLSWKNNLLVDGSIEVAGPPAISLSAGMHTQNFDTLATNGVANLWRDNFSLPGWYAAKSVAPTEITTYRASNGSDNGGGLYSFGTAASTERALGDLPANAVGTISYGVCFTNDTGASVSNFILSYTGEQWRDSDTASTNTLTFWYRVTATALTNPEPGTVTGWTAQSNLNFISPTVTGAGVGINGNAATNRHIFAVVPVTGLTVPHGHCVFFRWHDDNDVGSDQGLAVDDLTVAFAVTLPQLTSVLVNPTNGFASLSGSGETNLTYGIEAATNLNTPIFWQRIGSNTANGSGVFQFTDTNAPAFPMRFYRGLFP